MQSPFSHILFTNYAPNASETAQIIEFCSKPEAELAKLDLEIRKLQQALEDLTRQRNDIQDVVDSHRALLSPVRRVPVEILQNIFVLCRHAERNPAMDESEAPLLLGRICRSWREICIGTAELWSSLHLVGYDGFTSDLTSATNVTSENMERLVVWLERSGDVPLNISLFIPPHYDSPSPPSQFLAAILPYAHRWRCIDLISPESDLTVFRELKSNDVPLLETFSYRPTGVRSPTDNALLLETLLPFLDAAPILHQLSLQLSSRLPSFESLWPRLTELCITDQISSWNMAKWVQVLAACTRLRACTLSYYPLPEEPDVLGSRIVLPHLRSLSIHSLLGRIHPSRHFSLLDYLTLPNLHDLKSVGHCSVRVIPSIIELLRRSACLLEKLVIQEEELKVEDLRQCLYLTPDLRELDLSLPTCFGDDIDSHRLENILHALSTSTMPSATLCPNLRSVVFHAIDPRYIESLVTFLRSRVDPSLGVARVDSFRLHFHTHLTDNERAMIEAVAEPGVQLVINSRPHFAPAYDRWSGLDEWRIQDM